MALFFSELDPSLSRSTAGRDPLGILPIWTHRARDLVPHLSASSSQIEGFQLLFSILSLWPEYLQTRPHHRNALRSYYILMEQAFARATWAVTNTWPLPGRQRLEKSDNTLSISLKREYHLTQSQLANATWGISRGASERAGLLKTGTESLSHDLVTAALDTCLLQRREKDKLFKAVESCIDDKNAVHPISSTATAILPQVLAETVSTCPLLNFLEAPLLHPPEPPLTTVLSEKLTGLSKEDWQKFDIRGLLATMSDAYPIHKETLERIVRCEDFLAPLESVFIWLCSVGGTLVSEAAKQLPTNLVSLQQAQLSFRNSGLYTGLANERHQSYAVALNLDTAETLLTTLLEIHNTVADERGTDPWVHADEAGRLVVSVELEPPAEKQLRPGTAWRNDYYLGAFGRLSRGMAQKEIAYA